MISNIDTKLNINPSKSQIVLLGFLLLSGLSVLVGFLFIWFGIDKWWVPFTIGIPLVLLTFHGWNKSQALTDMGNSNPILVEDSQGNKITTHSAIVKQVSDIELIAQALNTFAYRKPLPTPDGMIDANFQPIENTEGNAKELVNSINSKVEQQARELTGNYREPESKQIIQTSIPEPKLKV